MANMLDLLTLEECLDEFGGLGQSRVGIVEAYITAVSLKIDELCGPVVVRNVVETHVLPVDYWVSTIWPYKAPIDKINKVDEYSMGGVHTPLTAETTTSKGNAAFLFDPVRYLIVRRCDGFPIYFPYSGMVVVDYDAGRFADTASVDERFKGAARLILHNLWLFARGTGNLTFGAPDNPGLPGYLIPNAAMALLGLDVRIPGIA